jgi:hypothetical protein
MFAVTSGTCTVDNNARCFRSTSYPSYPSYSYYSIPSCTVTVIAESQVTLSAEYFGSADSRYLSLNGVRYISSTELVGIQVDPGANITLSFTAAFEICGACMCPTLASRGHRVARWS